jgi:hypothetical protein
MVMLLKGSCRCGAVRFSVVSHTPCPFMRCYCSICRKTQGGGGYAINIMGVAETLRVAGKTHLKVYRALLPVPDERGRRTPHRSSARRHFCGRCGSALWISDPSWPELVHPFASAIDTPLPAAPEEVHLMLAYKAPWVKLAAGPKDQRFDEYPEETIEAWHKKRGLWID